MQDQDQALVEQVGKDNDFIKQMLDLIPPSVYFNKDTNEKLVHEKRKHVQGLIKGSKQQTFKREDRDLTEKALLKRVKFDPQQNVPVSQIQEPVDTEEDQEDEDEEMEANEEKEIKPKSNGSGGDENGKYTKIKNKQKSKKRKREDSISNDPTLKNSVSNMEELREKMKNRIKELQNKRLQNMTADEIQERKKLKRKESKLKLKIKRKTEKQNKVKGVTVGSGGVAAVNNGEVSQSPGKNTKSTKPVFNKEGKMVFSRFDFTESINKESKKSNKFVGKDYKRLLQKVEKQKEHVDKLKVTDAEKAKQVQEKLTWTSAIQRAEGMKVKDNPEMLKKAAKRKEKKKQTAKKHWTEREGKLKEKMDDKQKKRQKNIKTRKQGKIDKKIKNAKKRGRIIPGF